MNREGGAIPHAHTGGQNQGAPKVCQEWGVVWPCSQELRLISARARTRQPLGRRRLRPRRLHLLPEGSGAAAAEEARLLAPPLQGSPGAHLVSSVPPADCGKTSSPSSSSTHPGSSARCWPSPALSSGERGACDPRGDTPVGGRRAFLLLSALSRFSMPNTCYRFERFEIIGVVIVQRQTRGKR